MHSTRRVALIVIAAFVVPAALAMSPASAVVAAPVYCASEPLFDGWSFIEDTLVLDDGTAFAVGTLSFDDPGSDTKGFVAKFLPDGDLDLSFGDRGIALVDLGGNLHIAYGIVTDDADRLVIAGTVWFGAPKGFAVRMLPDGSMDPTFGTGGARLVPETVSDVALGIDRRVLLSAQDVIGLDADGDVDPTFGTNGRAGLTGVYHAVTQPNGRIVAVSGGATVHVVGLTQDGDPDATFGSAGTTDVTLTFDHGVTDASVAPDGTIAIAGQSRISGGVLNPFVIRLLPSGLADPAFANAIAWNTTNTAATSVTIAPDHSMGIAMSRFIGVSGSIIKTLPNGDVDPDFGDGGVLFGDGNPWSIRFRSDGSLLMAVSELDSGNALFGFDAFGDCFDPLADIDAPVASYQALSPTRILDTRISLGRNGTTPVPADSALELQVTGHGGVPEFGVSAVVLNITATDATAAGFVTAFPGGDRPRPTASNMNIEAPGQTIASLVTVPVSDTGTVKIYVQGGGHVVADVMGYYSPGGESRAGRLETIEPRRVLDTRVGLGAAGTHGRPAAGETLRLRIAGPDRPVPTTASAVVLNVTATESSAAGFVTVSPGGDRSGTSNLNVTRADQTIANQVIVPVAADGTIEFFTQTGTHLLADVAGWFTGDDDDRTASGLFVSTTPTRHLDTRTTAAVPSLGTVKVSVHGAHLVPATGAAAIVGTLTVTNAVGPGYFTVYPGNQGPPVASNLNVERGGQTIANHITTRLDGGDFHVFSQIGGDVIIDIAGWYTA